VTLRKIRFRLRRKIWEADVGKLVTLKFKFPSVTRQTHFRWKRNPSLGLPAPAKTINGIDYFEEEKLDAWQPPARRRRVGERARQRAPP